MERNGMLFCFKPWSDTMGHILYCAQFSLCAKRGRGFDREQFLVCDYLPRPSPECRLNQLWGWFNMYQPIKEPFTTWGLPEWIALQSCPCAGGCREDGMVARSMPLADSLIPGDCLARDCGQPLLPLHCLDNTEGTEWTRDPTPKCTNSALIYTV